jgi:hypothetical protein
LLASSASKAARAASHSAAPGAAHPVDEVGGIAELAMALIIASAAQGHHGPIGG